MNLEMLKSCLNKAQRDKKYTYYLTLRRVHATITAIEKQ